MSLAPVCIAQPKTPEVELAARIVAAKTETERAALLEEKKDLVTPKLARALMAQADRIKFRVGPGESLTIYGLAESIATGAGDKALAANILSGMSDAYLIQSDYPKAIEYAERSLKAGVEAGDKAAQARALGVKASPMYLMGERDAALALFEKSLVLRRELGDKPALAQTLDRLGNFYMEQGEYSRAMEYYQESLRLIEATQDKRGLASSLSHIGLVHFHQANYELALDFLQKGLTLSRAADDKEGIGRGLFNIGVIYSAMGQTELGLKYYFEVLKIAEAIGARGPQVQILSSIGSNYSDLGRYDLALEYLNKSRKLSDELFDKGRSTEILNDLATAYLGRREYDKALEIANQAITQARQLNNLEMLWKALYKAGQAHRALNQPEPAREMFEQAVNIIEMLRTQVAGGEQDSQRLFQQRIETYYAMTELLVSQNKLEEALTYAERAKGRVLLDVLQSGRTSVNKSMTADEQARESKLTHELTVLNSQITRAKQQGQPDGKRLAELEARLQKVRFDHDAFESGLYASHPELRLKRGLARTINVKQAGEMLPDAKAALIEYAVMDERTFLFVMTKGGAAGADLKVYPIDIKRADLAQSVESFRQMLAERDPGFKEPARKLYDLLLAPAQAQLSGRNMLIIVPDDALWELPFQALQTATNRYLLEERALSYAPSLSVLYEMEKQRKPGGGSANNATLLAFGNPAFGEAAAERTKIVLRSGAKPVPLPEAEREVKSLAEMYGKTRSRVYIGAEAREERAKAEAGNYKILHFATHGVLNNLSPMYSHLLLSQGSAGEDGLLEAWEIMKLDLKADLVVLSACETARGRVGAGEGMIGLTWALFVAGSPATLVSQWKVDSAATKQLMLDFHRNLRAGGSKARAAKAVALQQSALKMMKSGDYNHPFNWAGFIIVGDSR
ncbi:MAG: CHAT domain-containing protein [Pyrinomonadaceae bacterium]|nr:CHAT domain-containing protein [Pyrinomonadaceae bacterium]